MKEVSADDTTLSPRSDQTLDCSFETNRTPPKTKNVAFDLGDRDDSRVQQQSLVDDSNNTTSNTADNDKFVDVSTVAVLAVPSLPVLLRKTEKSPLGFVRRREKLYSLVRQNTSGQMLKQTPPLKYKV